MNKKDLEDIRIALLQSRDSISPEKIEASKNDPLSLIESLLVRTIAILKNNLDKDNGVNN